MPFPIVFAKKSGDRDYVSPIINFTGNAIVVAGGSIGLAVVVYSAFRALGIDNKVTKNLTAIPVLYVVGSTGVAILAIRTLISVIGDATRRS